MPQNKDKYAFDCHPAARSAKASTSPPSDACSPGDRYQELFVAVQSGGIFDDSKTFVDCAPRSAPGTILDAYRAQCQGAAFDLPAFVRANFEPPQTESSAYVSRAGQSLAGHIDDLWPVLTRHPDEHPHSGSMLQLPHAYVVPGGRFRELYYWDSYFTMLGLAESGFGELLQAMTNNFAYLIDTYGHVPNGTRTYYLSRSQPPVFSLMAELCESHGGHPAIEYLPQLRREHAFWMDGESGLRHGEAARRVVRLPNGDLLNRYWDDRETPREEAWREDVATAAAAPDRKPEHLFRDLRAAAESGWDFSTRWLRETGGAALADPGLAQIITTDILPVDLNALMHKLETTIADLSRKVGDDAASTEFETRAARRRAAVDKWMWSDLQGGYFDFDWRAGQPRHCFTAAAVVPLFVGMSSQHQADTMAGTVRRRLLAPGGLATTECASGEQWDRPNGWAPLQWMAVRGFEGYGERALAHDIRSRWLHTVGVVYRQQGKLVEKYTLRECATDQALGGGGGEYPLQDGFGWTNGVTRHWVHHMPVEAMAEIDARCDSDALRHPGSA